MITSMDLYLLHQASLDDFEKSGIGGYKSEETVALLDKTSRGLSWALEKEAQREKGSQGGFGFQTWLERLQKIPENDTRERMITINQILGAIHANYTGGEPRAAGFLVRDLLFEGYQEVNDLLSFLSNL